MPDKSTIKTNMKKVLLIVIATVNILASCNNNSTQTTDVEKPAPGKQVNHCYDFSSNKDSVFMEMNITGDLVTGDLTYKLFQKDLNKGTFQGKMRGDTLIADYKFMSEGTESVREVAFLKRGNDFVEGYGDAEEKNGKMIFKNTSSINYNSIIILKPVQCDK